MIGGSLAVLAALVVLLRAITSTAPAAPAVTRRDPAPKQTQTTPTSRLSEPPTTSAPAPLPSVPRSRVEAPPSLPQVPDSWSSPAAGSSDAPPGTRFNTKNLHFGNPQLREKIAANAPHIAACVAGTKLSGDATLTFVVAQRAGKYVVEQTDVDRDKSTIKDDSLLECLHKAALQMQFDGLPREAEAIVVTRGVTLVDGAVTDDHLVTFSYIR